MSHVATVSLVIKSLESLKRACMKLGLRLNLNQKTFRWWGRWVDDYREADAAYLSGIKPEDYGKCEHAIGIPDDDEAYEIGVVKNPKGAGFKLVFDFYGAQGRKMTDKVGGQNCQRLVQEYAVAVAEMETQELQAQGWAVQRVEQPNGDIQLVLEQ